MADGGETTVGETEDLGWPGGVAVDAASVAASAVKVGGNIVFAWFVAWSGSKPEVALEGSAESRDWSAVGVGCELHAASRQPANRMTHPDKLFRLTFTLPK